MTLSPTLVLRHVPPGRRHLARALAPEVDDAVDGADDGHGTWWELVDVAAPPDVPATGVALTRPATDAVVHVVALAAVSTADDDALPRLLLELVAALRCTDAVAVEVRSSRPDVLAHLDGEGAERSGDRALLRF